MTDAVGGGRFSGSNGAGFHDTLRRDARARLLLDILEIDYPVLVKRLSGSLGSDEVAVEALHDTYIKLRSGPDIGSVRNPRAYLYRMALNLARNRRRNEGRIVPFANPAFAHLPDMAPSQDRVVGAAQEMALAIKAMHSMSVKRQQIFLAKWRDEKSQAEIALEFGMHKRSVQKELAKAEARIRAALESNQTL